LFQFPLNLVHLPGAKNDLTDWLSRTHFDSKFGPKSEVESREAFSRMDTQDLSIKVFFKAQCPIPFQIWFSRIQFDDEQIETITGVLSPYNPQVIEGKLV